VLSRDDMQNSSCGTGEVMSRTDVTPSYPIQEHASSAHLYSNSFTRAFIPQDGAECNNFVGIPRRDFLSFRIWHTCRHTMRQSMAATDASSWMNRLFALLVVMLVAFEFYHLTCISTLKRQKSASCRLAW
jgi:hypothetical protein